MHFLAHFTFIPFLFVRLFVKISYSILFYHVEEIFCDIIEKTAS